MALRASDGDRERVAELLRDHCADGRLSFDELEERLERVYGARTYADLRPLTADLPCSGVAHPALSHRRVHSNRAAGAIVLWALAAMMLVPAFFAVVGALVMAAFAMALTAASLAAPFVLGAIFVAWTIRRQSGRLGPPRRPRRSFPAG